MLHPPAEFPLWVNSSVCSAPPWVTCSDKPSCRHTICCGIVGLALAWGKFAKFTTLFAHPQLAPATTKNHTPCCPLRHAHPIPVPKGVLCTIGMSMWSTVFSFTQSTPCTLGQFTKSLHMHTGLTAIFPMDGAPLCAHHTPFPLTFCQFSCTQALPHMFQIQSHCCIWMQLPTLSPTSWSDSASTPAPEAHHHSPATPGNVSLTHMCAPPSLARSCCIWTRPSVPAIPAPGAVWPTTGPKAHPSRCLAHPLTSHHHPPSPSLPLSIRACPH